MKHPSKVTCLQVSPVAFAVALSLVPISAWAEQTVVVTGARVETPLSETAASIGAVDRKAWDADKVKNLGEVLNRIPGVFWNDLGNEQHSMGIRQPISTNAVYQYLEDGIPIRPLGVFNHNALNETNINGSERIEVAKGAASSLYGSNAVGGAVNFITQRPSRTPSGYLGIRHDETDGFTRVDSGASNTWGDLGLRFSHYSSKRSTDNWQQYSGGTKDSLTLRTDYDLQGASWIRATLVYTDLDADMTGSLFENDYRTNPAKSINTFTWRKDVTTRATIAWEGATTRDGLTTVTLFARDNDHGQLPAYTITGCSGASCRGTINNNHVESLGLDVKHSQNWAALRTRLVSGLYIDRSQNDYVSDNLRIARDPATGVYLSYTPDNLANPTGVRSYGVGIRNDAAFAQLEFSPSQALRVTVGGRYDSITYDFQNNLTPGAAYGAPNEERSFSRMSPKIGATLALSERQSLYTSQSQGFTPPEVSQLYGRTAIPNLKPAVYNSRELGWRGEVGEAIRFDAAVYELEGEDTIVSYTIAPGNSENRNAGQTRSRGVELAISQQKGAWDWRLGGTVAQHKYVAYRLSPTEDYSGKEMPQAPKHTLDLQVGWSFAKGSRVSMGAVRQGSYWMNNLNTVRYAGHTLVNLGLTHALADGWEVWGQVRNLTDEAFAHSASSSYRGGTYTPNTQNTYTPGSPRSVMIGVTKTFNPR